MTVALAGEPVTIIYDGSNLADGDQVGCRCIRLKVDG
jgi:hypothetical protein